MRIYLSISFRLELVFCTPLASISQFICCLLPVVLFYVLPHSTTVLLTLFDAFTLTEWSRHIYKRASCSSDNSYVYRSMCAVQNPQGPGCHMASGQRPHTRTRTEDTLRGCGPVQTGLRNHDKEEFMVIADVVVADLSLSPLFAAARRRKYFGRYLLPIERIKLISTFGNLGNSYDIKSIHYPTFCSPS